MKAKIFKSTFEITIQYFHSLQWVEKWTSLSTITLVLMFIGSLDKTIIILAIYCQVKMIRPHFAQLYIYDIENEVDNRLFIMRELDHKFFCIFNLNIFPIKLKLHISFSILL